MKKLKILKYPAEVLKQKAQDVDLPLSQFDMDFIRNMWSTVIDRGIGLAAPQVGVSKKICIIKVDKEIVSKKEKENEFVMINPKIVFYSQQEIELVEGCLSFPGEYFEIRRPANIKVDFLTIQNFKDFLNNNQEPIIVKRQRLLNGWLSRVVQHEVDHLNGKLFINLGGIRIETESLDEKTVVD